MATTEETAKQTIEGARVRVYSRDHAYEGWVQEYDYGDQTLVLYDAERDDEKRFDSVIVNTIDVIEELNDCKPIRGVPTDKIQQSPYNARIYEFHDSAPEVANAIRDLHATRALHSFPSVRKLEDDTYEIVTGHRRVFAARNAGLETVEVRVLDYDDWEATQRFVYEHFPFPEEREDRPREFYTDSEMERSLERLQNHWSDEKLRSLVPIADLL